MASDPSGSEMCKMDVKRKKKRDGSKEERERK